jgi:hypothetical protein
MKTLVAIILALGVGFAAAYVVVSKQKDALIEQLKAQKAQPQAAVAPAPTEKVIMAAAPSVPAGESPQDILNDLLGIKIGSGDGRNNALRMVVFKLEELAQRGDTAVPAIRAFLGRNVDVDYNAQDNSANTNRIGGPNNFRRGGFFRRLQDLQTDWVVPPSLRLGLVGVLTEIGGPGAEQALADMLGSTGRGVEVAYLARVLEQIAPGKYRDAAVDAAKQLLMNPPAINSPDQLDDLSKPYLYGVLEMFNDTSFVPNAEQLLVGPDGRLDRDAMDYLSQVLKDQSVSALYAAYENQSLTNQFDKMNLGRDIMNYAGQSPQANQLFTETLNNTNNDPRMKAFTVAQLAGGGFGPFASQNPTDPQVVSGRIQLLTQLQSQYANDPQLSQAISLTINALQSGQPVDMRQLLGGGRGGRGFGGGGGGGAGFNGSPPGPAPGE